MGPLDNISRSPQEDSIRHDYQCQLLHLFYAYQNGNITLHEHQAEKDRLEQLCELEVSNYGNKHSSGNKG